MNTTTRDRSTLHRAALFAAALLLLPLACCGSAGTNGGANANASQANSAAESPSGANAASPVESPADRKDAPREPSLVSLSAGAFPVKTPSEDHGATASELLDERAKSCWRSASGAPAPHVFVLALPERTVLKSLEFDCAQDLFAHEGACAKDVSVEVSDASEGDGYQKIADVEIKEGADDQKFPVSSQAPGRWVRLTIKSNHGSKEFYQLNDFRATGTQLTHTPAPDFSGTFETNLGDLHLRQEGSSVSGCYTYLGRSDNVVEGGAEGRLLKINLCRYCGEASRIRSHGVLVMSPDGQRFIGLHWPDSGNLSDYGGDHWDGKKKSAEVGTCPGSATSAEAQLTKELEEFGRARVYGINFDTDSDVIKDESQPTLDKIAAVLKAKPEWKLTIEGHTDSTSTAEHNQQLSERRAASVKNYLQAAGIDPARLKTAGFGATKPVASNDTELGRAQNRRVELAKQ